MLGHAHLPSPPPFMNTLETLRASLKDRYTVERELGTGGMATVYLAHDLRHDREVAIKVLHPDLGAAMGGERFLAEIRTTAKLQHPHILPLLDSGDAGNALLYYVMPLVTGETLRARLERERQLPIPDAVRLAREVAAALDYAHRHGVIHRDIKPENILLHDGSALVADFGIALAVQQAGGARMTHTGLSLGTPQYMSPEQAMGEKLVDARSDVYALGVVTYEMLCGEPPFTGPSVQAIVAKSMTERPVPLHAVRDTVPPHVEDAVLTALAKLPADRFASAAEFASALGERDSMRPSAGTFARQAPATPPRKRSRDPLVLGLGVATMALAGTAAMLALRPGAGDPFPYRVVINTGDATTPSAGVAAGARAKGAAALSPDGRSVIYSGLSANGRDRVLFVRRLDQLGAREIEGTNGIGGGPVFSPDGKEVAFVAARRRLVKVPIEGGSAVVLAQVPDYGGLDWSVNGEIVVGAGIDEGGEGLLRLNAAGGTPTPLTHVDKLRGELSHQLPRVLADGKTVLFSIWVGDVRKSELAATSLDDGKVTPLGVAGVIPLGVIDGGLTYLNADGVIMAVPFDVKSRRTTGAPIPVQDSVRMKGGGGSDHAEAAMSHAGGLVYLRGIVDRRLVWVDRLGAARPAHEGLGEYTFPRLSPDGRRIAITIANGTKIDIWVLDRSAGILTPLSTTGGSRNPSWSADGARVFYVSTHGGRAEFWSQVADGSRAAEHVAAPPLNAWNADLSPDGRAIAFNTLSDGNWNVLSVDIGGGDSSHAIAALPTVTEVRPRWSPDGRWVAYQSDESGRNEIYLRSRGGAGGRLQISASGGRRPVWRPDGKELFYWEDRRLTSATLAWAPAPRILSRTPLFEGRYEEDFDVTPDGKQFLMIQPEATGIELVVIPSWRSELRRMRATEKR